MENHISNLAASTSFIDEMAVPQKQLTKLQCREMTHFSLMSNDRLTQRDHNGDCRVRMIRIGATRLPVAKRISRLVSGRVPSSILGAGTIRPQPHTTGLNFGE